MNVGRAPGAAGSSRAARSRVNRSGDTGVTAPCCAPAAPTIYARLGVRPLLNAAGILTNLGGSLMLPEVKQAMEEASREYVNLLELHRAASARIAQLAGVEAALVTSGAAAALLLGT